MSKCKRRLKGLLCCKEKALAGPKVPRPAGPIRNNDAPKHKPVKPPRSGATYHTTMYDDKAYRAINNIADKLDDAMDIAKALYNNTSVTPAHCSDILKPPEPPPKRYLSQDILKKKNNTKNKECTRNQTVHFKDYSPGPQLISERFRGYMSTDDEDLEETLKELRKEYKQVEVCQRGRVQMMHFMICRCVKHEEELEEKWKKKGLL